jgi:hypothetical protein
MLYNFYNQIFKNLIFKYFLKINSVIFFISKDLNFYLNHLQIIFILLIFKEFYLFENLHKYDLHFYFILILVIYFSFHLFLENHLNYLKYPYLFLIYF